MNPRFEIQLPRGSGKACAGCAKTISLQVIERLETGYYIKKLFRFTNGDEESMRKAYSKAQKYLAELSK